MQSCDGMVRKKLAENELEPLYRGFGAQRLCGVL